jgi:hypothetical protein
VIDGTGRLRVTSIGLYIYTDGDKYDGEFKGEHKHGRGNLYRKI